VTAAQTEWLDHAHDALRRAGYRAGGARTAVVELLAEQDCCLTAQEIFDELRGRDRRAGIASVYRALDVLTSMKLVQRLEMGEGVARYEPAYADGEHHHHVVCDTCGKVAAFEDENLEAVVGRLGTKLGYDLDGHDVTLRGACPDCRHTRLL
jgi:Fur family transcriptional regulator, ferric uptake regulator